MNRFRLVDKYGPFPKIFQKSRTPEKETRNPEGKFRRKPIPHQTPRTKFRRKTPALRTPQRNPRNKPSPLRTLGAGASSSGRKSPAKATRHQRRQSNVGEIFNLARSTLQVSKMDASRKIATRQCLPRCESENAILAYVDAIATAPAQPTVGEISNLALVRASRTHKQVHNVCRHSERERPRPSVQRHTR